MSPQPRALQRPPARARRRESRWWGGIALVMASLLSVVWPGPAVAQGEGAIVGRVFDGETGAPVAGVSVVAIGPPSEADGEPSQHVQVTGADGSYRFAGVPVGTYTLSYTKPGYRASSLTELAVQAGQAASADFPLPPAPPETADQILELDAFVVEASTIDEEGALLELRMDSDQLINTMSAAELAKFAASDVADALKRVAGVNVVGGQFAIIRGLEDRYNSTLYNGAPVPSPDPDKQSVQLDLFPSDIVSNLVVAKTFGPDLPSNSSGGAIDIVTHDYPENFQIKISGGTGFNARALDRFLRLDDGSPAGIEEDWRHVMESEFGGTAGGRKEVFGRELRFKGLLNREIDFDTAEGFQESREPRRARTQQIPRPPRTVQSGDLSLGELNLTGGRFDLTESERTEQDTAYLGLGFDLDQAAKHRIDGSIFYTRKEEEVVQLKENGYLPGFDYGALADKVARGLDIDSRADFDSVATLSSWIARSVRQNGNETPNRGPLWFTSFFESKSFLRERDLTVYQLNGEHEIDWHEWLDGLRFSWATNHAKTTQEESSYGARYFFEPADTNQSPTTFPTTPEDLGPGLFAANNGIFFSNNDISEDQDFGRVDAEWERVLHERLTVKVSGGGWWERASRDVTSTFLESPSVGGSSQFAILAPSPEALGQSIFRTLDGAALGRLSGLRETANEASREIDAWHLGSKATIWERVDLLAGVRVENIFIESRNDPFTGELAFDGSPAIFPTKYLFFDRLDNPARGETSRPPPPGTTFNDQLLGISVPIDPVTGLVDLVDRAQIDSLVNGLIDERRVLPAFGFTVRPLEGLAVRGAYSKTVARPSFREIGYYVSVEPGSDDLVVGNPQLKLSDVTSWDARVEYTWGGFGDLVAASVFYKEIKDPIESIVVRNPVNLEGSSSALFRTFFNNPNEGTLRGVEVEARKNLGFLRLDLLQYFSIGGNFTYIDAEVDRTEAELARTTAFFGVSDADAGREEYVRMARSRRLFGQPEWIANADISFDHPEWGTKVTLAFFAISDLLDAAGSASVNPNGEVRSFTLDRYVDSFHQLDLVASQAFRLPRVPGEFTIRGSAKNLTDSTRRIVYDPEQLSDRVSERELKIGRDFSFSLSYTFSF